MKYIVQHYSRYSIYEPAEGGYYYEGMEPDGEPIIRETRAEAIEALRELVAEYNEGMAHESEGYLFFGENDKSAWATSGNHKYIGDGEEYYVEPMNRRGRHRKGRVPYC